MSPERPPVKLKTLKELQFSPNTREGTKSARNPIAAHIDSFRRQHRKAHSDPVALQVTKLSTKSRGTGWFCFSSQTDTPQAGKQSSDSGNPIILPESICICRLHMTANRLTLSQVSRATNGSASASGTIHVRSLFTPMGQRHRPCEATRQSISAEWTIRQPSVRSRLSLAISLFFTHVIQ